MIDFENVTKSFGNNKALDNVSLKIRSGEIFGIAGPNGAGKTTLVRILCTALRPDSGYILVDDLNVIKNEIEVKKKIGYLPEEPNLYERLSAEKFLDFFAQLYGVTDRSTRIDEVLDMMELSERKKSKISTFSKGMRHRISLARALLHNPQILVLDEPTMGLDPAVATHIRELVHDMRGNKTVILCTHYMEEAEQLCDRMTILNKGQVAIVDSPAGIKQKASEELKCENTLDQAFVHFTR